MRKDLGYYEITIHSQRHTFASRLAQLRVPLLNIQEKMGHKNINTTLRYAHLCKKDHTFDMNVLAAPYGSCD